MKLDPEVIDRYGRALYDAANRMSRVDQVEETTQVLVGLVPRGSQVRTFLEGPQFNVSDQMALVDKAFANKIDDLALNLLKILIRRRRIFYLEEILTNFHRIVEESRGVYHAELDAAIELSDEQKSRLQETLEKFTEHKLKINWRTKPELIGGVIFKYQDLLLDDSVRTRLRQMRHDMLAARI